ncbi:hypothetical protein [Neorhizobium sp. T6_25]|uniref:hypothetical protein n=1 Tax=Neorhizobium sp. T6_25 TaxID=2093833 RepID=UPI000CFA10E8|nr:hypothetical protein [Neorhizobium sp. T6_25]
MRELTQKEHDVVAALVEAWNAFLELPIQHGDDISEFRHGIHRLQEKVLARPTRRMDGQGRFA